MRNKWKAESSLIHVVFADALPDGSGASFGFEFDGTIGAVTSEWVEISSADCNFMLRLAGGVLAYVEANDPALRIWTPKIENQRTRRLQALC